jgi:hypothetical protein
VHQPSKLIYHSVSSSIHQHNFSCRGFIRHGSGSIPTCSGALTYPLGKGFTNYLELLLVMAFLVLHIKISGRESLPIFSLYVL